MKGFVLAGTHSGVGKTTITLGMMRALRKRGNFVAPFKVGPDYIDPMFHTIAAGHPSYNLDLVMMGRKGMEDTFSRHAANSDYAVVEGVMGLFDGLDFTLDNGSSAHLARLLDLPVFLVVDAHGMAASVLAHIQGFSAYDPNLKIAGIILNRVASKGLFDYLKGPIESALGLPCIGFLEKDESMVLKSRHLGLIPVNELDEFEVQLNGIADRILKNFDWERIEEILNDREVLASEKEKPDKRFQGMRIAIARDDAFNFYYQENLDLLESWGIEWVPCSPLKDSKLPDNIDALVLGGGFPEVFAEDLMDNQGFVKDLKKRIGAGMPVYAECGGYIYLSQSIRKLDGRICRMAGILPGRAEMTERLQRFGYVSVKWGELEISGHEFHRSMVRHAEPVKQIYQVRLMRDSSKTWQCGEVKDCTLAAYPHLHFASHPEFLRRVLEIVQRRKEEKQCI